MRLIRLLLMRYRLRHERWRLAGDTGKNAGPPSQTLRSLGLDDFSVLEGRQRIGRIRLATERMPCLWLWSVTIHLPGGRPMGSCGVSGSLESSEGENYAGATRGGLPGREHRGDV